MLHGARISPARTRAKLYNEAKRLGWRWGGRAPALAAAATGERRTSEHYNKRLCCLRVELISANE